MRLAFGSNRPIIKLGRPGQLGHTVRTSSPGLVQNARAAYEINEAPDRWKFD
jgi:hypothetical protein